MFKIRTTLGWMTLIASMGGARAAAQTPAPPANDEPSIKIGAQIFLDYTVQQQPKITDSDGNSVTLNQFQVGRSYINFLGTISKTVSFRVTPDVTRQVDVASSLNGNYVFRLKFAYAQWNLDDRVGKGSWARFGQQPTPWLGFMDEVYRYRFQGQEFEERDGFMLSADAGATFHYQVPRGYGDLHGGVYNGDGWQSAEANDQKGWMVRGTLRPAGAREGALHGLRVSTFIDRDFYVKKGDRFRTSVAITYEHKYVVAAFDHLVARDQASANVTARSARGWSAWITPRTTKGLEGLLRYDQVEPNTALSSQRKKRTIGGVAYWFPRQSGITSALLFDVDNLKFDGFPPSPATATQRKIAVHMLVNF